MSVDICWFCREEFTDTPEDGDVYFCTEFDTFLHLDCLRFAFIERNENGSIDAELEIIAGEFGLKRVV